MKKVNKSQVSKNRKNSAGAKTWSKKNKRYQENCKRMTSYSQDSGSDYDQRMNNNVNQTQLRDLDNSSGAKKSESRQDKDDAPLDLFEYLSAILDRVYHFFANEIDWGCDNIRKKIVDTLTSLKNIERSNDIRREIDRKLDKYRRPNSKSRIRGLFLDTFEYLEETDFTTQIEQNSKKVKPKRNRPTRSIDLSAFKKQHRAFSILKNRLTVMRML